MLKCGAPRKNMRMDTFPSAFHQRRVDAVALCETVAGVGRALSTVPFPRFHRYTTTENTTKESTLNTYNKCNICKQDRPPSMGDRHFPQMSGKGGNQPNLDQYNPEFGQEHMGFC